MKKSLRILVVAVAVAALVSLATDLRRPYRGYARSEIIVVEPGARADRVAGLLVGRGVLRHRLPFLALYAWGRLRHRSIKAGEYLFERPLRPTDVYQKLAEGRVYFHLVVIPEGSDRFDMARIFQQQLGLAPKEFLRATEETALIRDLDGAAPSLEGYLFPDSYRFPAKTSAAVVVQTMVGRFRQVLNSKFPTDLTPGSPQLHQAVTLASLVEKETPDASERPMVAGVFRRRLEKGMLLECDPTAVYAARLRDPDATDGTISRNELSSPSAYNTYRHPGLPPGPICSPGEASIRAALHPTTDATLYFVSNNHGGHVFARTLEEHYRNVARYRRAIRQDRQGLNRVNNNPRGSQSQPKKTTSHVRND